MSTFEAYASEFGLTTEDVLLAAKKDPILQDLLDREIWREESDHSNSSSPPTHQTSTITSSTRSSSTSTSTITSSSTSTFSEYIPNASQIVTGPTEVQRVPSTLANSQRLLRRCSSLLSLNVHQPGQTSVLFFPLPRSCLFFQKGFCQKENECEYRHNHKDDLTGGTIKGKPNNFTRLCKLLDSANTTMELCMYTVTYDRIRDSIAQAAARGVRVRLITETDTINQPGSDIRYLADHGVDIRHDQVSTSAMHHKFTVIDGEVLLSGSFNYTRNAVTANRENLIISSNPSLVVPYAEQFELLWKEFAASSHVLPTEKSGVPELAAWKTSGSSAKKRKVYE